MNLYHSVLSQMALQAHRFANKTVICVELALYNGTGITIMIGMTEMTDWYSYRYEARVYGHACLVGVA